MPVVDKSQNKLINTISKDFEIWEEITEFGSKFYLVAQLPSFEGTGGAFTWRYDISDYNAIKDKTASSNLVANVVVDSEYNIIEGDTAITSEAYKNSFYFGNANQLLFLQQKQVRNLMIILLTHLWKKQNIVNGFYQKTKMVD